MSRASEQLVKNPNSASDSVKQAKNNLQKLNEAIEQRQNDYEQFQANSLQQRIAANQEAYRDIERSAEKANTAKISKAVDETQQLLQEIPDNLETNNASNTAATPRNRQLTGTDTAPNKDNGQAEQAPQSDPIAETKKQIQRQTEDLQNTTDGKQRAETAKSLDKSLGKIAEALKQENAKRQQNLDQKQMASHSRLLSPRRRRRVLR